ncbi:MAG: DNA-binding response regulator [Pseudomonadota bacterium]
MVGDIAQFKDALTGLALVVDDDPASISMVTTALEENGTTVLVARDGQTAIDLAQRVQPDVVLMDAVMPKMDGFETCRRLKAPPILSSAPIVFMTGLSAHADLLKGLQAGGVDYVTKPVMVDELLARIATHVVNARLINSARAILDHEGRSVLAFTPEGEINWATPGARELLQVQSEAPITQAPTFKAWISNLQVMPVSHAQPFSTADVQFSYLGSSPSGDLLISATRSSPGNRVSTLAQRFVLTEREAEVLLWLTQGKTNRDIAEILSVSARTVNKHLEQVFQKMGVDNRTSAALKADRELFRQ